MSQPVIINKDDDYNAIRYQALFPIEFYLDAITANQTNATPQVRYVLPMNVKILALAANPFGTVAGTLSLNIVLGTGAEVGVGVPDNRGVGVVPPTVATAGTTLFAADTAITMTADTPTLLYPGIVAGVGALWDVIWPAGGILTLRTVTNGAATGSMQVNLVAVAVNRYYNLPDQMHPFAPSATML